MNPTIDIFEEQEINGAWLFHARLDGDHVVTLRLSWQDYEEWASGALRPEHVARAVLTVLMQEVSLDEIPPEFDAARYRRSLDHFDEQVRQAIAAN